MPNIINFTSKSKIVKPDHIKYFALFAPTEEKCDKKSFYHNVL